MTALDNDPRTDSDDTPFFLNGNFAPVFDELTDVNLNVTGSIPPSLSGRYLRNGSNPKSGTAGHWFFGDGMVHGVRLDGGKAEWYRNRLCRPPSWRRASRRRTPRPCSTPPQARRTPMYSHTPDGIRVLEEGHLPYELSPELDTLGYDDFGGKLTTAFTAHPKLCPETGELHFFGYSPLPPFLTYHVLDASGALVHSAPIEVPQGTMMHDFMITRDHAIFMDLPVVFNLDNLEAPLGWDDNYGARIGIVPRWAPTPTFAGSRSIRATCSIPSTPTSTATKSSAMSGATRRCGRVRWNRARRRSCTVGRST